MSKELENKSIGSDLCDLAVLLQSYGICNDISPLQNAGNACMSRATATTWRYKLDKIVFVADEVGGRLTNDSTDITVSLSVDIVGFTNSVAQLSNPLDHLIFDLELNGLRINPATDTIENLYAAWHLDRHIFGPTDAKTKYSHPLYHFTFGGNKMEARGHDSYGSSLIMPSPRLIHPPMDAVLGVDFILQNYIHKNKINTLLSDKDYVNIVKNSQLRIWKPFFCSLYTHWDSGSYTVAPDFTAMKLFPLYY